MLISRLLRVAGLMAFSVGLTAADTVAPQITDAVTQTNQMNEVDEATLPPMEEPTEDAFPTSVDSQVTDATQPTMVNGAIIDATTSTGSTPGVYTSDVPTTVNPQVTDAIVTNVETPGVYIDEQEAPTMVNQQITDSLAMNQAVPTGAGHQDYRPVENESHMHTGSKY